MKQAFISTFESVNIKRCFCIRSFTNNKERAKQYFTVVSSENCSESLVIRKLVLSKDLELYGGNSKIVGQFKDYYLFEQMFSIKLETLKTVMSILASDQKLLKE